MNKEMKGISRAVGAVVLSVACLAPAAASAQPPQPPPVDEFVPIDQLPPQDQMPAAPLLIGAYSFVAVALFTYVLSVSRRLGRVQREIARLETDLKKTGRA
jgi:CcmD family protein